MKPNPRTCFVTFVTILILPLCVIAQRRVPVRVISPGVLPDNRVTFRIYSRDASGITISGEWRQGQGASENLIRNDTGLFCLTVGPLEPELYGYTLTVDGVRTIDPNNVQVRRDSRCFSGINSGLRIQGDQ